MAFFLPEEARLHLIYHIAKTSSVGSPIDTKSFLQEVVSSPDRLRLKKSSCYIAVISVSNEEHPYR